VCFHILNKKEKSAYKLTWIFLILLFPIFGGIVYLIFHTQSSPVKLKRDILKTHTEYQQYFHLPESALPVLRSDHREYAPMAVYLEEFAGFPVYTRTSTEFFGSGEEFFEKVLLELKKAESYIFLEFFIIRTGLMFDPILNIIKKKAQEGLDVRIIYDDLGSFNK
jgi:cardiolipin synthase